MSAHRIFPFLIFLIISSGNGAFARTMVEAEHLTTKGCKIFSHKDVVQSGDQKIERVEWTGQCKAGFAEGDGTSTLWWGDGKTAKNVATYQAGRLEGMGVSELNYPDGRYLHARGTFRRGLLDGQGELTLIKSKVEIAKYKGEFSDDVFEGKGRLENQMWTYIGEFHDAKPSGSGRFEYRNGSTYEGEVRQSKPNGRGKLIFAGGITLSGHFSDGKSPASGRIDYPSGGFYEGEILANGPHGKGRLVYPDRSFYFGDFKDGQPHGEGVMQLADGKRVNVAAENGKYSRRYDAAELAEMERVKERRQLAEQQESDRKEAEENRSRACYWAMMNRPTKSGNSAESLANAAKCEADPYADQRPSTPSYICSRGTFGSVQCSQN